MERTAQAYVEGLLARGRHTFTGEEAQAALGSSGVAAYHSPRRLRKNGWLAMPRRGFYLIVDPGYRELGALPPAAWIDDLMRFHGAPYYVGLLTAASLHGAGHQRPQGGTTRRTFSVPSRWWRGEADITTYEVEEILATKLRALYQRKKGRDLFDLWVALAAGIDPSAVVDIFLACMRRGGYSVTRALFEENLAGKAGLPAFSDDVPRLLSPGVTFDVGAAIERVRRDLVALVPGEPWKGAPRALGALKP